MERTAKWSPGCIFGKRDFQAAESLIRTALRTESVDQLLDIKASYEESVAMELSYPKQARYHAYRYLSLTYKQEKFLSGAFRRRDSRLIEFLAYLGK
ncbi:hypothetical protein [Tumebacillus avium]|uniref:hypothetical protein n=1 Tax=Tumebacillus avium TaxID=1903704 RepID=UPI0012FD7683|nr:hypothetical protein [Tumebacillus avium]